MGSVRRWNLLSRGDRHRSVATGFLIQPFCWGMHLVAQEIHSQTGWEAAGQAALESPAGLAWFVKKIVAAGKG